LRARHLIALGSLAVVAIASAAVLRLDGGRTEAPAPPASVAGAARPIDDIDLDPQAPSEAATDRAMRLVGQARRLADKGKFDAAKAKLDAADKAAPGLADTAETRRRIGEMSTPQGQFAFQIGRARTAIETDDAAEAEKALAEAERLQPQAPEIAVLRQALRKGQQKEADRHRRILIASMRAAIARRDFAAADGALNEASRLDVLDPLVDQARAELVRAHDADRTRETDR
jgi:tetratricopeptide (TPR) repeat protein